jgi:hypothetical protein
VDAAEGWVSWSCQEENSLLLRLTRLTNTSVDIGTAEPSNILPASREPLAALLTP